VVVPRASQADRIADIAAAGTRVFGRLGYRRTQMASVAKEAGLSTGAIYTYVSSKEALFHLVVAVGFRKLPPEPDLPLGAPPFADTLALIADGLRQNVGSPGLRAALEREAPDDVRAEFTAIVEERYDSVAKVWPLLAVVERCAVDIPELQDLYFRRGRRSQLSYVTRYLDSRAQTGRLRKFPDTEVAARALVETVVWFAWHRREDKDPASYDEAAARATVIELMCNAFVPEER
jgi:AcrR family transcriptional regulator